MKLKHKLTEKFKNSWSSHLRNIKDVVRAQGQGLVLLVTESEFYHLMQSYKLYVYVFLPVLNLYLFHRTLIRDWFPCI